MLQISTYSIYLNISLQLYLEDIVHDYCAQTIYKKYVTDIVSNLHLNFFAHTISKDNCAPIIYGNICPEYQSVTNI